MQANTTSVSNLVNLPQQFVADLEKSKRMRVQSIVKKHKDDCTISFTYKTTDWFGSEWHHPSNADDYGTFITFHFESDKLKGIEPIETDVAEMLKVLPDAKLWLVNVSCCGCTDLTFTEEKVQISRTPEFGGRTGIYCFKGDIPFEINPLRQLHDTFIERYHAEMLKMFIRPRY